MILPHSTILYMTSLNYIGSPWSTMTLGDYHTLQFCTMALPTWYVYDLTKLHRFTLVYHDSR